MNPIVSRVLERHRNKLLMSAALLCGGVAVYAGSQYVNEQVQAERARLQVPDQQTVEVVVASAALVPGDTISAANMAVRSVPVDYVPSGAVTPDQFEALDGQRLMQPMHPGEILSAHALESADRQMFSSRVRPGIRAMTISVDEINSISGMLQPGDRVDLLLTARPPSADGRGEAAHDATVPLLQNLLVMATGRQVRPGDAGEGEGRSFSAVTVEVTPEQAQRLIVAQRAGRLTAVLRNPGDGEPMNTAAIDVRSLFPQPARAPVVPRRAVVRRDERPQMIVGGMGQAAMGRMPSYSLGGRAAGLPAQETGASPWAHAYGVAGNMAGGSVGIAPAAGAVPPAGSTPPLGAVPAVGAASAVGSTLSVGPRPAAGAAPAAGGAVSPVGATLGRASVSDRGSARGPAGTPAASAAAGAASAASALAGRF